MAIGERVSTADVERARGADISGVWEGLGFAPVASGTATRCPWREDLKPSLQVGGAKNIVFDHGTGESLDPIALVRKIKNCGFAEAVFHLITDFREALTVTTI